MKQYLKLLRPHQWLKNGFVLMPAFFAGKIGLLFSGPRLALATLSFCFVASAVYIFNDIRDLERDKLHEIKRRRPLALGTVALRNAVILMIVLVGLGSGLALMVSSSFFYVVVGYVGINILYSLGVKHISLIDISFVAFGFVLRVLAGGIAAEVPVSKWIILMTFLLASCLALGKRRDDLLLDVDVKELRPALSGYSLTFIDVCLVVLSVTTIVCYIMYTVSEEVVQRLHSDHIYLTSVFVIIGILRFLQIAIVEERSGSPTHIILKDNMIQAMVGLWVVCFMIIIYASQTGN
ncbi:MAG: UbiA prenyltransferase family protein [bacterium]|nr:UbiA prenyltransferase family protein [bacterium]